MPVAIGSDHAGFPLKESLVEDLRAEGYHIEDFGVFSTESMDYPDIAREVAEAVASGRFQKAIIVCGTGIGVCITANKVKGVRAAVCSEAFSARMARQHNNANVICVGARVVGAGLALDIVKTFIETEFEAGSRHERRVDKINALDNC
ncbi:MAG: ribose 5-phosphate isomerase B [Armatimonadota bacterium]|nr:ribose 5-phosphate isomerase B [bacterium]